MKLIEIARKDKFAFKISQNYVYYNEAEKEKLFQ